MRKAIACGVVACLIAIGAYAQQAAPVKNVIVYDDPERYAGWPANNGIWIWDNEIVVGFHVGYYKEGGSYPIDREKPQTLRQARSLDGGETWTVEKPTFLTDDEKVKDPIPFTDPVDFTQPNFAMRFQMQDSNEGYSSFLWSNDRCKTWNGPFKLPMFDRKGILARTDYIINGKHDMLAFLAATKDEGGEGWPFVTHTTDGGKTWEFVSWIGEQPGPGGYTIMPSTVRLSDHELFTYVRCRVGKKPDSKYWIEPYRSLDNGKTWTLEQENRIENGGNPPQMIKLKDGRLALTYGGRDEPFGIRAKLSSDGGKTWTPEMKLRDDGGAWDLGYVRTVQRPDGKIFTAYYFNDKSRKERYIGGTIWDPGKK